MAEVHDCLTPTAVLMLMENGGVSERGMAWRDVLDGEFDLGRAAAGHPDDVLKSFGHPIGASGLRVLLEMWLQLQGEERRSAAPEPRLGFTENLGDQPGACVIAIVGSGRNRGW